MIGHLIGAVECDVTVPLWRHGHQQVFWCLPSVGSRSLVHPGVRGKHWGFEIDLSQPRHETAFCWRHTWASNVTINRPYYPYRFAGIQATKCPWHHNVVHRYLYNCDLYTGRTGVSVDGIRCLEPQRNVLCVAISARATPRHFLIWMRTMGQLQHAGYRGVFMLK